MQGMMVVLLTNEIINGTWKKILEEDEMKQVYKDIVCRTFILIVQGSIALIVCINQARTIFQKLYILFCQDSHKISLPLKFIISFQCSLSLSIANMAYYSIDKTMTATGIMMDFLCVTVIAEFDNWFGTAFENILDIFYKNDSIANPEYLDFKISALD